MASIPDSGDAHVTVVRQRRAGSLQSSAFGVERQIIHRMGGLFCDGITFLYQAPAALDKAVFRRFALPMRRRRKPADGADPPAATYRRTSYTRGISKM